MITNDESAEPASNYSQGSTFKITSVPQIYISRPATEVAGIFKTSRTNEATGHAPLANQPKADNVQRGWAQ
jgi:hypothetical protein